jgi:hypothetical protein
MDQSMDYAPSFDTAVSVLALLNLLSSSNDGRCRKRRIPEVRHSTFLHARRSQPSILALRYG